MVAAAAVAGCGKMPSLEIFKPGRPAPGANADAAACVLIDTDMALDDARAVAAMVPTDKVRRSWRRAESPGRKRRIGRGGPGRHQPQGGAGPGRQSLAGPPPSGLAGQLAAEFGAAGLFPGETVPLDPPETFLAMRSAWPSWLPDHRRADAGAVDIVHRLPPGTGHAAAPGDRAGRPPGDDRPGRLQLQLRSGSLPERTGRRRRRQITWVALPENADQTSSPTPNVPGSGHHRPARHRTPDDDHRSVLGERRIHLGRHGRTLLALPRLFTAKGRPFEPRRRQRAEGAWRIAVNDAIERQN